MNKKILVIEDDVNIVELIKFNLEANNYIVDVAYHGKEGLMKTYDFMPDLILLDIMMPELDGLGVLNQLRNDDKIKNIPVIIVTAKTSELDKIVGFEIGADDYITKPFSVNELVSRVKAHLRRSDREINKFTKKVIEYKNFIIDLEKYEVLKDGKIISLSLKEFEVLKLLLENRGKAMTRDQLLDEVWGYDYYGETRTVDVHIRHLRSKLDTDKENSIIHTVRGIGYIIN
ncbi:MAG: response regulator transcription factor [Clostridiales bacterium]|nr:response regulator transcription factor [Clostridiales bacterium]